MKILLFDPSGTTNYCNGLAEALNKRHNVDVVARDDYRSLNSNSYNIYKWFRLSDCYAKNKIQKGLNYLIGYIRLLWHIKKEKYDIIHIQWLLLYKLDIVFLHLIKRYTPQIVYTAHNAIPHVNGTKQMNELRNIYNLVDTIIVHGEASRKELQSLFGIDDSKIAVQPHGINDVNKLEFNIDNVSEIYKQKISNCCGKVFLFLGVIFDNKGIDRLFDYWYRNSSIKDLLVVAGKITEHSDRLKLSEKRINQLSNVLFKPGFVSEDDHNYLYSNADIIVMPYRHASMSGVVFDAATFKKTVLTTNAGCIPEYLEKDKDSFISNNTDTDFFIELDKARQTSPERIKEMGQMLNHNIFRKYNWDIIANLLTNEVYLNN